jgi:hypothetical protein
MEAHLQGLKDYPGATLEAHPGFVKQEHNTHNAVALLNYLKCIALKQLML